MNNCLPWDTTATDADGGKAVAAAGTQVVQRLIVVMLLIAATLDLTRCGLVMAAARHPAPTAGLVTAGLAAAALTARTARGYQAGRRWAGWAALLISVASAPQAAVSGFRSPYMIPDTATAALGILLAVTILATVGRTDRRDTTRKSLPPRPGSYALIGSERRLQPTIDRTPSANLSELALHLAECAATAHQPRMTPASPSPSVPGESWELVRPLNTRRY